MNEGTSVKLHIKSSQADSQGSVDTMEFYTEGRYYEKKDSRYISYEESEISGLEGTTTYLKLGREEASLIRNGAISSKMVFKPGCETKNIYKTAYGDFDLTILTRKLDIEVCNNLINSVYLKYELVMGSGDAFVNEMTISVYH